ncbi:uncharacterized protein [Dermacentor albipictus]|uniref:uncharacterized protein n=1 Tax=Dermacentor albipictus TaxID=60249 RepID=UPI0038FC8C6C
MEEGTGMRYVIIVCGLIIIFALATATMIFLLAYQGDSSEVDDAVGSNRSGGGDAPPPMEVPVVEEITTTPLPTALHTQRVRRTTPSISSTAATIPMATVTATVPASSTVPTMSSARSTTPPPPPPPPLMCSVGTTAAAMKTLFPPDNACDIVVFTHVRVFNRTVRAVLSQMSFEAFRNVCAAYRQTTCGLSFTSKMLADNMFSNTQIRSQLKQLRSESRVHHYGILDIYGTRDSVQNVSTTIVPGVLSRMRQLLGNDTIRHKVIVGIGYYYYNDTDSWEKLAYAAENVASKDVDVLVIITTIITIPSIYECITLPVNAHKSPKAYTPTLEHAFRMAREGFGRRSLTVAFSFQMGVVMYTLKKNYSLPINALYEPCSYFAITDYSQACQPVKAELNLEKSNIGFNNPSSQNFLKKNIFHTFDTVSQMQDKAMLIMEMPGRRANFSWFLINVHLTDVTRSCLPKGPFQRVKEFKEFYYNLAQKPAG